MATGTTAPGTKNMRNFPPSEEAMELYLDWVDEEDFDKRRPEFNQFIAWTMQEFGGEPCWDDREDPSMADCPDEVDTDAWWYAEVEFPRLSKRDTELLLAGADACGVDLQLEQDQRSYLEDCVDRDAHGGWDAWRLAEWERAHGRCFAPLGLKKRFTASVDASGLSLLDPRRYEVFKGFVTDFIDVIEGMGPDDEVVVPLLEADEKDAFDEAVLFFFGNSAHGRNLEQLRQELHDGRQLVLRRSETDAGEAAMALRWGNDEVGNATLLGCFDPRRAAKVAALAELRRHFPPSGGPELDGGR
jgi:hypothetical protein